MNMSAAAGSAHQSRELTELNRQIVWAHGFGNNEMLQRVGECGAVTTKMLSHGPPSRWPSCRCEVREASGLQPPVAETVATSTAWKKTSLWVRGSWERSWSTSINVYFGFSLCSRAMLVAWLLLCWSVVSPLWMRRRCLCYYYWIDGGFWHIHGYHRRILNDSSSTTNRMTFIFGLNILNTCWMDFHEICFGLIRHTIMSS